MKKIFLILTIILSMTLVGCNSEKADKAPETLGNSEEEILIELTDLEKELLSKPYAELDYEGRSMFAEILEKFKDIPEDEQKQFNSDMERMKVEKEEWVKEQERIAKEKEQKEWEEFVANNTKTLSAGEHFIGEQIEEGVYDVTFPSGGGNFIVYTSDGNLLINEIGGSHGISKYRAILPNGSEIKLSGFKATFTPIKTNIIPYESLELYAGYWIVGQDLTSGRYKATSGTSDSGNFIIISDNDMLKTNEILGGDYGVEEVIVNLSDGDIIKISSLPKVLFTPEK